MPVHIVSRGRGDGPSGMSAARREAPSLLAWFQAAWADGDADGFGPLFAAAAEKGLPPPATTQELEGYLREHLAGAGEVHFRPHCVQVRAADDGARASYVFDDAFLQEAPRSAAFLLHEGWELPADAIDDWYQPEVPTQTLTPSGQGVGATYLAFLTGESGRGLGLPCRVAGTRLPGLAAWLTAARPAAGWPFELRLLRSQVAEGGKGGPLAVALRSCTRFPVADLDGDGLGLDDVEAAQAELEEALAQRPEKQRPNKPKKSLLQVEDHVAQLCLHVGKEGKADLYHRWVLFDDMWAAANKALADGVLRYARRWDVLSPV